MKKICKWCKCEFEAKQNSVQYCSHRCAMMAQRKHCFLKHEAQAKELGVTIEEVERLTSQGLLYAVLESKRRGIPVKEAVRRCRAEKRKKRLKRVSVSEVNPKVRRIWIHRPKTYAEILRENRESPLTAGWRGQVVMGGWI